MIQRATNSVLKCGFMLLLISEIGTSQDITKSNSEKVYQIITQEDLIFFHDLPDQGLMSSKELFELDRILKDMNSKQKKMDYKSYGTVNLSRTNRNFK